MAARAGVLKEVASFGIAAITVQPAAPFRRESQVDVLAGIMTRQWFGRSPPSVFRLTLNESWR